MTTSSERRARVVATLASLVMLHAGSALAQGGQPSAADLESARELYKEARELRQKGDLRRALERFKAAHAYGQTPVTGLELGRAHMDLGELIEAREAFLGVARIRVAADETEKSAAARTEAAELAEKVRPRIPTLTVKVTGLAPDAQPQIFVDGAALPVVSQGSIRKVNPGQHVVVAKLGMREEKREAQLAEGETKEVVLDLTGAVAEPAGGATSGSTGGGTNASGGRAISPVTWIGAGLAVAGLGTGAVTGILALGKAGDVSDACVGTRCPPSAKSTVDSGRTLATISTVGFAVGIAGAGLAAVGYFVLSGEKTPKPTARVVPVIGPASVGVVGRF